MKEKKQKRKKIKKYEKHTAKKVGLFQLLNPKNLQAEVNRYGYTFSKEYYVFFLVLTILVCAGLSFIFRLQRLCVGILLVCAIFLLPKFVLNMYKRMYQQKRFAEASDYCENIMYAFKKSGTILIALKETLEIFDDSHVNMKSAIEESIMYLERGDSSDNRLHEEALAIIEKEYSNTRIRMVHKFLVNVERHGGNFDNSMNILLNEKARWVKSVYALQRDKQMYWRLTVAALIISIGLCFVVLNSMKKVPSDVDVMHAPGVQVSSMLLIIADFLILIKASGKLTVDWLSAEKKYTKEYLRYTYDNIMNYDAKKQMVPAIIVSGISAALAVMFMVLGSKFMTVVLIAISIFAFVSPKLGYKANFNNVLNLIYLSISDWLIDIALLLQANNVQVAIANSYDHAPAILQPEIEALTARLNENPGEISSYTKFCEVFDMPDVKSAMRMLYTLSEIGSGDSQEQMKNLIGNNSEIIAYAEKIRNSREMGRMKLIFSMPVLSGSAKMLIDLTTILLYVLPSLTNTLN